MPSEVVSNRQTPYFAFANYDKHRQAGEKLTQQAHDVEMTFLHDVNVFPIELVDSGAVRKFVINHVTNARRAHFAP